MTEATPIRPEDKEDHSLEISAMLADLAAVGDMLTACAESSQELCDNTIRDVGYLIHRNATRIDELILRSAS